jgi:hypothetical protein
MMTGCWLWLAVQLLQADAMWGFGESRAQAWISDGLSHFSNPAFYQTAAKPKVAKNVS